LKNSGDERRGMRREVVRQIGRMRVKGMMGRKCKDLKGGCYRTPPPLLL